ALLEDQAEGALQRAHAHAARRAVAEVLGLRRVRAATADEDRRADGAVTGAAGALLLVDLLARSGDGGALLGGLGAFPTRGELGHDHLLEEVLLDLGGEH